MVLPYPNLNGAAAEVWERIDLSNFNPHFAGHVITYSYRDGLNLIHVDKWDRQGAICDKRVSSLAQHAICHLRDRDDERCGEHYVIVGTWFVMDYDAMHDVKGPRWTALLPP